MEKSKVIFDETEHTYTLNGKRLGGVTDIVKWMFPDTYSDIPQEVLDKAAVRGSSIHEECQMYNELGVEPSSLEAKKYVELISEKGIEPIESEYLVSDNKSIASCIDMVGSDISIWDYKTTSKIHWNNVTYQTNIYRYLFELQNKDLKVSKLGVIWLPKKIYGECEIRELPILDKDLIRRSIEAYLNNESPDEFRKFLFSEDIPAEIPSEVLTMQKYLINFETQISDMKKKEEDLKYRLLLMMEENGVKKWETDKMSITYVGPSARKSFDSERFKKEVPQVYEKFIKVSKTKPSIRIKIK